MLFFGDIYFIKIKFKICRYRCYCIVLYIVVDMIRGDSLIVSVVVINLILM